MPSALMPQWSMSQASEPVGAHWSGTPIRLTGTGHFSLVSSATARE